MAKDTFVKRTGWVVMATTFAYNDEYHACEEGGKAVVVHYDKRRAAVELLRLTANRIRGECLGDYCEGVSMLTTLEEDEFEEKLYAIIGQPQEQKPYRKREYKVPEDLSDVDALRVARLCDRIEFFFLEPTQVYELVEHPFVKASKKKGA